MKRVIFTAAFGLLFLINQAAANYRPIRVDVNTNHLGGGISMQAYINVAGVNFYGLIDSGATSSSMNEGQFQQVVQSVINHGFNPSDIITKVAEGEITFADGSTEATTIYEMPTSIGGIDHKPVSFSVYRSNAKMLIGMDLLAAFRLVIDAGALQVLAPM